MALPQAVQIFLQSLGQAWQVKVQAPNQFARLVQGEGIDYNTLQSSLQQVSRLSSVETAYAQMLVSYTSWEAMQIFLSS